MVENFPTAQRKCNCYPTDRFCYASPSVRQSSTIADRKKPMKDNRGIFACVQQGRNRNSQRGKGRLCRSDSCSASVKQSTCRCVKLSTRGVQRSHWTPRDVSNATCCIYELSYNKLDIQGLFQKTALHTLMARSTEDGRDSLPRRPISTLKAHSPFAKQLRSPRQPSSAASVLTTVSARRSCRVVWRRLGSCEDNPPIVVQD